MRDGVPIHNLRANHAEWTPACVIFLDTETRTVVDSDPEILGLRLWVATLVDRRPTRAGRQETLTGKGHTAAELADWIAAVTRGRQTVWLYAHNLSFDLTTTRLPLVLNMRGWTVTDAAIGGKAPWVRMAKGTRRLCMVDSWSWLPHSMEHVGGKLGLSKPRLPDDDDSDETWFARCAADVEILGSAVLGLMAWWDRNKLGRWTISGAGCGWNAFRHTPTPYKVTIDPDAAGIKADRAAVHGGRRGVWRVGTMNAGPFLELDFTAAYPTIAATMPLPTKRSSAFPGLPLDDWRLDSEDYGISAEVELCTDVPRWPVKLGDTNWYPVGRFRTVLAGPDIADARRLGCLLAIGPGYVHRLGYAMENWAHWCLAVQRGQHPDSPPVAQLAAKSWGRSVIGKWAAHSFDKIELGPSPVGGWAYREGWDDDTDSKGGMVDIAGRRWWVTSAGDAENAYPAVLAWVEAEVRARLSRVIEAIGPGCVVQADTDGLIVAQRTIGTQAARGHLRAPSGLQGPARLRWVLDQLDPVLAPLTLRIKRQVPHVTVLGPQHLEAGGQRRLSGIDHRSLCPDCQAAQEARRRGAKPVVCDHVLTGQPYRGRIWPKLKWQLQNGDPAGYVRPMVTAQLKGPYAPGWVTTRGTVVPPEAVVTPAGETQLLPPPRMTTWPAGARLTEGQHPFLAALW